MWRVSASSLRPLPSLLPPGLEALAPELARSRHACGEMIARTVFAFLLLKDGIIHMDVVEDRAQILMAQQFLEAERIAALDQVIHGKDDPRRRCPTRPVPPHPADACPGSRAGCAGNFAPAPDAAPYCLCPAR